MGERIRPSIEGVRSFFSPMPRENKGRKWVEIPFYFHSRDLCVGKTNWIYNKMRFLNRNRIFS
ncbi:hypothetical protein COL30_00165 [Bacillus pseudomycoides]|nr:hypothetical protein COO19_07580 [Bacillus pseudomycoides]PEI94535.1 hypothetical protein CN686_15495 [Bacillus pseudomycoides]PEK28274.1 hypothetical protein CN693_06320 [Bacillus pseudomycoides]PEM75713.1 hypothetical protein CN619_09565 [Bacillus pseudomycoides]PEO15059.1 hypothetical protein CN542_17890 [Bacillus pseudomycoides]